LVKVLDFGISKLTRPLDGEAATEHALTTTSVVLGSVHYMSPEQLAHPAEVDARADVWALGVVLYELCAGSRPFEGENAAAVGARIASVAAKPLRALVPETPEWVEAIVLRCLSKNPDERFADAGALGRALANGAPPKRRRGRALLAAFVTGSLLIAGWLFARPRAEPPPAVVSAPSALPERPMPAPAVARASAARPAEPPSTGPTASAYAAPKPVPARKKPAPIASASPRPPSVDLNDPALTAR
jgi:serine/threonine-protein kinase